MLEWRTVVVLPVSRSGMCHIPNATLMYAITSCRPVILFHVNFVSLGNQTLIQTMVNTVEMILSCVVRSKTVCLSYGGPNTDLNLKGYYDASLYFSSRCHAVVIVIASFGANGRNKNQRSSYTWMFVLGGCAPAWIVERQFTTSLLKTMGELLVAL